MKNWPKLSFYVFLILIISALFLSNKIYAGKPETYQITSSDNPKFVWFRVAKVGTRSILNLLSSHFTFSQNGYNIPFNAAQYQDYFKFAFVRNPWDRVVSCYCNKVLTKAHEPFRECFGKGFPYFVNFINRQDLKKSDIHIRLQSQLFPVNQVQFIGKHESFNEDLQYVMSVLGIVNVIIPHRNSSEHDHYSKYYDDTTRKIIAKKYHADIMLFKYTFETIQD